MSSRTIHAVLVCSQCESSFEAEIPVLVDVEKMGEVLEGTLHRFRCPRCQTLISVDAPLLIFIPDRWPPWIFIPTRRASFRDAMDQLRSVFALFEREPEERRPLQALREVEIVPPDRLAEALQGGPSRWEMARARMEESRQLEELESLVRLLLAEDRPRPLFEACRRIREAGLREAVRLALDQLRHRLARTGNWVATALVEGRLRLVQLENEHDFLVEWLSQPLPPVPVPIGPRPLKTTLEQWEPDPQRALQQIDEAYKKLLRHRLEEWLDERWIRRIEEWLERWKRWWEWRWPERWWEWWRWPEWWEWWEWLLRLRSHLRSHPATEGLPDEVLVYLAAHRLGEAFDERWEIRPHLRALIEEEKSRVAALALSFLRDSVANRMFLYFLASLTTGPLVPLGVCMICPQANCGYARRRTFKGEILICPNHHVALNPDPNRQDC